MLDFHVRIVDRDIFVTNYVHAATLINGSSYVECLSVTAQLPQAHPFKLKWIHSTRVSPCRLNNRAHVQG